MAGSSNVAQAFYTGANVLSNTFGVLLGLAFHLDPVAPDHGLQHTFGDALSPRRR